MRKTKKPPKEVLPKKRGRPRSGPGHPVANKIRLRAEQLGIDVAELLDRAGLGPSFAKDLDQGRVKKPNLASLECLAEAGQTTVSFFQGETEDGAEGEVVQLYRKASQAQRKALIEFMRGMFAGKG